MLLLVLAVAGGLVAGRVRHPAGGHGAVPHLRRLELVVVGLGLALLASLVDGDASVLFDALSIAVLATFAGLNRGVTGVAVVGVGLVLNLGAVVLNNGMPVRGDALVSAGVVERPELARHREPAPRHVETDADNVPWLGAIVPVSALHTVVTFGDLILLAGLADAARDLSRRRARLPEVDDGDEELWPAGVPRPAAPSGPEAEDQAPATTEASADQDWGAAPSGAPESGSQCSANPLRRTALDMDFWKDAALPPSPAHLAARQDK